MGTEFGLRSSCIWLIYRCLTYIVILFLTVVRYLTLLRTLHHTFLKHYIFPSHLYQDISLGKNVWHSCICQLLLVNNKMHWGLYRLPHEMWHIYLFRHYLFIHALCVCHSGWHNQCMGVSGGYTSDGTPVILRYVQTEMKYFLTTWWYCHRAFITGQLVDWAGCSFLPLVFRTLCRFKKSGHLQAQWHNSGPVYMRERRWTV